MEQHQGHSCNCPFAGRPVPSQAEIEHILRSAHRDELFERARQEASSVMHRGHGDHELCSSTLGDPSNDSLKFQNYMGTLQSTMSQRKVHPSLKNPRLLADYIVKNQEHLKSIGVVDENNKMGEFQVQLCMEHGLEGLYPINHVLSESCGCSKKEVDYKMRLRVLNTRSEENDALVAQIPWMRQGASSTKLSESQFYSSCLVSPSASIKAKKLNLFYILNDTFPFFLPKRYHTMDCLSIQRNSKSGHYWTNASHFFHTSYVHGYQYFKLLADELKKTNPKFTNVNPEENFQQRKEQFRDPDSIEECQTAEEFLLEPWVLLQLPFQPTLLHQWAVALQAEALKLRNQIADFYVIAYPKTMAVAIENLAKISSALTCGANSFLSYYFKFCTNAALNIQAIILLFWNDFLEVFPTTYAALTFALSKECKNVIAELKNMAWSSNNNEEWVESLPYSSSDFGLMASAYNMFFWKFEHPTSFLFTNETAKTTEDTPFSLIQKFKQANSNALCADSDLKALKNLVQMEIVEPGYLKGEKKEIILNVFNQNAPKFMVYFRYYKSFRATSSRGDNVRVSENGIVNNLARLFSDIKITEALGLIKQSLKNLVVDIDPNSTIYIDSVGEQDLQMTIESIEKALQNVLSSTIDWSFKKLVRKVRATCFSRYRTVAPECSMSPEELGAHFQERIKNLVFTMFDEQYKSLTRGPFNHYPESLYVQYILPCFVASYMDLDQTEVSPQIKEKYLFFVDTVIKSYENAKFYQKLSTQTPKVEYYEVIKRRVEELHYFVKHAQEKLKEELPKKFGDCFADAYQKRLLLVLPETKKGTISPWLMQQYMYLNREWAALEQCSRVKWIIFCVSPLTRLLLDVSMNFEAMDLLAALNHRENIAGLNNFVADMLTQNILDQIKRQGALIKNLNRQQALSLLIYNCFKDIERGKCIVTLGNYDYLQGPAFPLDEFGNLFWRLLKNDRLLLKIAASADLLDEAGKNVSYIPLELARTEPICRTLLNSITPKGKIYFPTPGTVTFFPIKHCRWCGLVWCDNFRLCPQCKDDPEYPDENFFCSVNCEKLSLTEKHTEEHANYLLAKLNINE